MGSLYHIFEGEGTSTFEAEEESSRRNGRGVNYKIVDVSRDGEGQTKGQTRVFLKLFHMFKMFKLL